MKAAHVVTQPAAPFAIGAGVSVHQVPMWQDNLSWLVVDAGTGECAVVDGTPSDEVARYAAANGLRVTTILNTHTHPDHIGINRYFAEMGQLADMRVIGPAARAAEVPGLTEGVAEGDTASFAGLTATVWLTEGHIDGHISYVFGGSPGGDGVLAHDGAVFCGDTLFGAGCGYLFDGPPAKMHASLRRLMTLPDTTRVCCAHEYTEDNLRFAWSVEPGNPLLAERIRRVWRARADGACSMPSRIADERTTNPFVRTHSAELRRNVAAAMGIDPTAPDADVFAATRALKDRKTYKQLTDKDLPL